MASPRWSNWTYGSGPTWVWMEIQTALLEDIRDRLTQLKAIFEYPLAQDIPRQLRLINRNTRKKAKHGH